MIHWELFFKLTNYMLKMLPRQKRIRETKRNEEIYEICLSLYFSIPAAKFSIIHVFAVLCLINSKEMAAILELLGNS